MTNSPIQIKIVSKIDLQNSCRVDEISLVDGEMEWIRFVSWVEILKD